MAKTIFEDESLVNSNRTIYGSTVEIKVVNGEQHDVQIISDENEFDRNYKDDNKATFIGLLRRNRPFRLYLLSYIITHTGEWLTYIASITVIESLLGNADATSRTAIGILVVVRLIPNVVLMSIGGTLADSRDRRESMIVLDIIGALVVLLFMVAFRCKSIVGIYLVTFIQQCVAAVYEPCRSSIIPLLVTREDYLKKATTLASMSWSLMAAVGSSLGGVAVTSLGVQACFGTFIEQPKWFSFRPN
jgi:Na+/melibiose symporter-like transporter